MSAYAFISPPRGCIVPRSMLLSIMNAARQSASSRGAFIPRTYHRTSSPCYIFQMDFLCRTMRRAIRDVLDLLGLSAIRDAFARRTILCDWYNLLYIRSPALLVAISRSENFIKCLYEVQFLWIINYFTSHENNSFVKTPLLFHIFTKLLLLWLVK